MSANIARSAEARRSLVGAPDPALEHAQPHVPAIEQGLRIIEFLASSQRPVGVSEAARATAMAKSTAFAILKTLGRLGYTVQTDDHRWALGLRMAALATANDGLVRLEGAVRPILKSIATQFGWPSHLAVYDRGEVLYLAKVEPPRFVRFDTYPGKRAQLHLTALGKAMAAHLSPAELAFALGQHPLGEGTQRAIKTHAELERALTCVRELGYAIEWEEGEPGVCCIAAPVRIASGEAIAALGIVALIGEMPPPLVAEVGTALRDHAGDVEKKLGGGGR